MNTLLCITVLVICIIEVTFSSKCGCPKKAVPQPGQTCVNDQDCVPIGQNFVCFKGKCLCTPGFHLENGQCVEECETYGTTYIEYVGLDVQCIAQEPAFDIPNTMPACQLACDNLQAVCLSYTFDANGDFPCIIRLCDPLNDLIDPSSTPIVMTDVPDSTVLYVRSCA